jgi:hypothetical protein
MEGSPMATDDRHHGRNGEVMQSDTYSAKAKYCWQMAAKALTPAEKQDWLKLAADWSALADEFDSTSGALPWKVEA